MSDGNDSSVPSDAIVLQQFQEIGSTTAMTALSHDCTLVAYRFWDGTIRIWNTHDGTLVGAPLLGHDNWVNSVTFSSDSKHLVSGSDDCTVRIWDVRDGSQIGEPLRGHEALVTSVAFSPDGTRIVSGSYDGTIRIWDAHNGASIGEPLLGHDSPVWSVSFSLDGSRIVSGSEDGTARIWNARDGSPIGEPLRGHASGVESVAFSPDGSLIASGSDDRTIRFWDASDGSPVGKPLQGHGGEAFSVGFSSDSSSIVSGSWDRTVRIWDARDGTPIGEPLRGHEATVSSAKFSPDSNRVVSASYDGTVRVWDIRQMLLKFYSVSSKMSPQDMFRCLVKHGCTDLSSAMHPDRYSSAPMARGGFGDIWKGELTNGMVVAIKCMFLHQALVSDWKGAKVCLIFFATTFVHPINKHRPSSQRAMRETYLWSKVQHENVQPLTGVIVFQGLLGMVSPWMENGNLQSYLGAYPDVERHPLCIQLAAGVAYLHRIDMVHGDLKALNVLVSPEGVLKISDFDHAILANMTLRFSHTSKHGGGTLRWMAPELLELEGDEGDASPVVERNKQTDMYALGMTLLEIVTGRMPYSEFRNDMSIYRAISLQKPPKRPQELSATDDRANEVWQLLLRCWDHDPAARPDAPYTLSSLRIIGTW
ncbi:WD40 repeat-like protein [Ceratobasidium sp. AG-I]|nr:WD40 repeat-like protein [Ceratobasidium sp. AG-I]